MPEYPQDFDIFAKALVSSQTSDLSTIQATNRILKEHLKQKELLTSPMHSYIVRMANRLEQTTTRNNVNEEEIQALKTVISARKRTAAGFRGILKGAHCITRPEYLEKIREREMQLEEKKKKRGTKGSKKVATPPQISIIDGQDILEEDNNGMESD